MTYELVNIPTLDGLLLDGAFARPTKPATSGRRAWVFVHGTGANFTSPGVLQGLATILAERGEAVLRLNTRGHDLMARIPTMQGSAWGGAAYEKLDDAPLDVAAACAWLDDQDYSQISLLGHSLGGVKVVLAQAKNPIPNVDELVALSPPRLAHDVLAASSVFREDYLAAAERVAAGRGQDLVKMREPVPLMMSAEGVMQKYGPQNRFDFVSQLPRIHVPSLIVVDAKSTTATPAFAGLIETLTELSHSAASLEVHLQQGVDIHYRNAESALIGHLTQWRSRRLVGMDVSI